LKRPPKFVLALAIFLLLISQINTARENSGPPAVALRSAIPVLCTEKYLAGRTKVRGTAVVVDANGTILTAAHVVLGTGSYCTLTVLVPGDDWSAAPGFHAFAVQECATDQHMDVAVCDIKPLGSAADRTFLRAASTRMPLAAQNSGITVTGFAGWGLVPVARRGKMREHQLYHLQDGTLCDLATDVAAFEGMSGSPVVNDDGEVTGLITTAGIKQYSGTSFGISIERAAGFLRAHGVHLEKTLP